MSIDEYAKERVTNLAEGRNQQVRHNGYPNLEWAPGVPIMDELDEEFGDNYLIVDNLNDPEIIEEETQENNEIEKHLAEGRRKYS